MECGFQLAGDDDPPTASYTTSRDTIWLDMRRAGRAPSAKWLAGQDSTSFAYLFTGNPESACGPAPSPGQFDLHARMRNGTLPATCEILTVLEPESA